MINRLLFILTGTFMCSAIFAQTKHPPLQIAPLTGDFYIYTTYNTYESQQVPANGMYLVTDDGVVMFDTPWDTTQFQPLLDSIAIRHQKKVIMCFATHWHSDKTPDWNTTGNSASALLPPFQPMNSVNKTIKKGRNF